MEKIIKKKKGGKGKSVRLSKKARTKKQNGFRQFWGLGNSDVHTENFDVSKDDTLLVREGNYQYDIGKIINKFGTPTEIFFPTVIEERVRDLIETFLVYIKIVLFLKFE